MLYSGFHMKKLFASAVLLSLTLCACAGNDAWPVYNDDEMKFAIAYPKGFTTEKVRQDLSLDATGSKVSVPFVHIRDGKPGGNSIRISRTDDMAILPYLQSEKPFFGRKTISGLDFQQFELAGSFGFVTGKNRYFYIFQSAQGPDNPLLEKMLRSLVIR